MVKNVWMVRINPSFYFKKGNASGNDNTSTNADVQMRTVYLQNTKMLVYRLY